MTAVAPGAGSRGLKLDRKGPIREALDLCARHFRYALLFSALVNVLYLAPTLYMLLVYDMVVPSGSDLSLVFVTIALSFTLILLTYLDQVRSRILAAASMRLDRVFATRIFRRVMAAPSTGQPVRLNQLMRDFDTIRSTVTGPAALAMFDAPWIPIYVSVCFFVHPLIGSMALGGAVILFVLAIWNERSTRDHFKRAADASAASYGAQESAGASAEVVRALGMTDAFAAQFDEARNRAALPQAEAARANGRIGGLIRFLRLFLQSVSLGVGAWLAIHNQISGGAVFAASMLAGRSLAPIDLVVAQWRAVSSAMTAYQSIREVLVDRSLPAPTHLPDPEPSLSLERVTAAAPTRDRALLRDISMGARKGMVVGVLGPSGSGKTTLLQIIANARGADGGEIRLGGARYADWDPQRLGRLIGYLPQDCVLFPGTVKDNISRFDSAIEADVEAVDRRAVAAAQAAGVHELILALPKGYDTPLGPRGRGLSAGQQQRVALARALYGEPILLVFDEPNSNLDAEGEAKLVQVIERQRARGAMVIIAAHRMGIIGAADVLAILKDGQLERFGPRQEVLDALRPQAPARPEPGRPLQATLR